MKKKSNFKIGDRVVITHHSSIEDVVGKVGTVVAIDEDGDELLKMDEEVGSFDYCNFNSYQSDKEDLINIDKRFKEKITLLKDEKI